MKTDEIVPCRNRETVAELNHSDRLFRCKNPLNEPCSHRFDTGIAGKTYCGKSPILAQGKPWIKKVEK